MLRTAAQRVSPKMNHLQKVYFSEKPVLLWMPHLDARMGQDDRSRAGLSNELLITSWILVSGVHHYFAFLTPNLALPQHFWSSVRFSFGYNDVLRLVLEPMSNPRPVFESL